ncbi:PREDICTED: uncharacterized protein LOC105556124 [Vollenhovia emeryi]|uniref:uncharacterized protein LOC105556124 n=1 Tax=Vollenhovia emeryi TaxID=411798 RepID=UPI0005F3B8B7|nr:PREDICTED: uncharacterized protein LOC105556124 [Vollenhovia emeryi]
MADESLSRDIRVTKLSKAAYNRWRIEIRDALESHRIWEVASNVTVKPEETKTDDGAITNKREIEDWKVKDSKARSIIRSTLDDATFDQVCDCESSADIMRRIKTIYEPKTLNVLLELLRDFFGYNWKPDSTVGTFVAGLKILITLLRWSLLSEDVSLELFLEKLADAERNIAGRLDETPNEVFKAQSKPVSSQFKKTVERKFQGKCHKCGKKGHMQRDCWLKEKSEIPEIHDEKKKKSKGHKEESGLTASSVFKSSSKDCIIADSGASVHLTRNIVVLIAA